MLKSLKLKNFTVFPEVTLQFGSQLNVFIGEHGTGKSHLLKLAYSILAASSRGEKESGAPTPTADALANGLAKKLRGVFRPDQLGHLVRRDGSHAPVEPCRVDCDFAHAQLNLRFSIAAESTSETEITECPEEWIFPGKSPIFVPTKEIISLGAEFVSTYELSEIRFEETWRDAALRLAYPLAKGPRIEQVKPLLEPLETLLGGTIELASGGSFYLVNASGRREMHLVAEGLRKIAMLARMIATGAFVNKGYLFWDEPEANLNPKVVKLIARTILHLAGNNTQVFIATHSLFLMRELYILQQAEFQGLDSRCFGLNSNQDGSVSVQQGKTMDDVGDITSLDEELHQSERYMDIEVEAGSKAAKEPRP